MSGSETGNSLEPSSPVPLRVLFVEDSEDDALIVIRKLMQNGFKPVFERVETPEAMKDALKRQEWDLVLSDYSLPRFDAPAALRVLRETGLDVPLILITGNIGEEAAVAAVKAGASDYILKGNLARLATAVSREIREAEARRKRRRAEEAQGLLTEASALLVSSLDYEETLKKVARLVSPRFADWCVIFIATEDQEGKALTPLEVAHSDPNKLEQAREMLLRYPLSDGKDSVPFQVLHAQKSQLLIQISDEQLTRGAKNAEHLSVLRGFGLKSVMLVPLAARGRPVGEIAFASAESRRTFDLDDLKTAEELARRVGFVVDNARLYQDAQQAIRVRDEFLSVASHELRTPLSALVLQLQILARTLSDARAENLKENLNAKLAKAVKQTDRLGKLIDSLLDVSRITTGRLTLEREEFDVAEAIRDVTERFSEEARKAECDLVVKLDVQARGWWDRIRVEQIVTNLLSNAIKYARGRPIEVSMEANAERVRLSIRDYGIGIAPEDLARIFGRFARAAPSRHYGGLGLGLYITREMVEAHGGSIRVASKLGAGSTFIVELPRWASKAAAKPAIRVS